MVITNLNRLFDIGNSKKMKNWTVFIFVCLLFANNSFAQSYNQDHTALANFLTRMYENAPFEGVRLVDDYDNQYLMSVLALNKEKYTSESTMNRVASVKASSQASRFFNGSEITSDLIIRTTEKSDGTSDTEMIENIKEKSIGYVKALELLTSFDNEKGERVFIYITPISQ